MAVPESQFGSTTASKASKAKGTAPAVQPPSPALIICRNKHWRYISSFHGPWLQLPPEILETLAHMNYNTPRPRPIDPAVFFDLVKIRRLVDEATNLAVRAASGVASIQQNVSSSGTHHAAALGLGFGYGPGGQTKLSRERKHRMREQATQKLSRAYHLDEIACSVATMQSASPLEEVAALVLQRNPEDPDAKYVHFFHEKIPSRQLAESTTLRSLSEIISDRPTEGEPLRTRATVRVFKEDYEGAVADLTEALRIHRLYRPSHVIPKPQPQSREIQVYEPADKQQQRNGRRQDDIILKEEEQPSSLEIQLLFQRAGVYLTIACQHVAAAFPEPASSVPKSRSPDGNAVKVDQTTSNKEGDTEATEEPSTPEAESEPVLTPAEKEAQAKVNEARKAVRTNAKRALRDYIAYLSHFEYTPDLPIEIAEDFARKVNYAANGVRMPRSYGHPPRSGSPVTGEAGASPPPHRVFALSELFMASPPSDLPPYPSTELAPLRPQSSHPQVTIQTTTETLTYHPLLTDALHSLLLCHCLVQTSAKELLRHANMVARLTRLADGYPAFQVSRSPARADWIEVLRAGGNWIQLVGTWEDLCAPTPVPIFQSSGSGPGSVTVPVAVNPTGKQTKALPGPGGDGQSSPSSSGILVPADDPKAIAEKEKRRQERIHHQAVLDALGDDRVNDEASFRLAIRARQMRAERDYRLDNAVAALDAQLTSREPESPSANGSASGKSNASALESAAADIAPVSGSGATPKSGAGPSGSSALARTNSGSGNSKGSGAAKPGTANGGAGGNSSRRWSDDAKDYPILTDRAMAVSRWVLDAPPNAGSASGGTDGARRRKKKGAAVKRAGSGSGTGGGHQHAGGAASRTSPPTSTTGSRTGSRTDLLSGGTVTEGCDSGVDR